MVTRQSKDKYARLKRLAPLALFPAPVSPTPSPEVVAVLPSSTVTPPITRSKGKGKADFDNSGTIDYGEFLAATMHLNKLEREENVLLAFSFFDKDGSGDITINELQQACRGFGLCDVHPEEMIKEIDQDKV
nr:calcium-dependent protein kinase 4 [Quercus suber]